MVEVLQRTFLRFIFYNFVCCFVIYVGVGETGSAIGEDGVLDIDTTVSLESTWHAMEDLVSTGLVRSIGIRFIVDILQP